MTTATAGGPPVDPRLLRRSRAVRRQLVAVVALGTVTAVLVVLQAWALASLVVAAFDGRGTGGLTGVLVLLVVVLLLRASTDWWQRVLAERAAGEVVTALRVEVAEALVADRPTHRPPPTGRTVALLGHGLDALGPWVSRYLPALGLALTVPAVTVAALAWADLLAAATVVLTLPLVVVFMVLVGWTTRDRTQRRWEALARLGHHFGDVLAGRTLLTVLRRDAGQARGLLAVGERHRRATMRALRVAFLSSLVLELVATISVALVAVGVGLRLVGGGLDLRTGLFVLLLAPEAYAPLRRLGAQFHDSAEGAAAAREALDVLEAAGGTAPVGRLGAPDLATATVRVRGLSVRHEGRTGHAPGGVDLDLAPGTSLALVGPSGGGKSTLLDCLRGRRTPAAGRVLVGDVDLALVDPDDWARQVAWVPQHPELVPGTVADNVRLDTEVPDAEVRRALRDAGAGHLDPARAVAAPGVALSSGERRRVAVARALVRVRHRGARLLLLDEPTAGLDAASEQRVLDALHGCGATLVTAAHRRAAVERCDTVVEVTASRPSIEAVAR